MGLSVIVPVYNGEKYIKECLESITNQTYKDLQIIVINDGSTDNTKSIISNMSMKDMRIEVINRENKGASSARNLGLKYIKQDFVTFVDCDDTLERDMYECLMKFFYEDNYDIVHCGYKRVGKIGEKLVNGTGKIYIQENFEALKNLISGRMFVGSLWNKIYRINLINDIKFDETLKINEDILFNYKAFKKCKKSVFIDIAKYNYIEREDSTCNSTKNLKKAIDSYKVSEKIYNDCKCNELKNYALERFIECLLNLDICFYNSNEKNKKLVCSKIKLKIRKMRKNKDIKGKKRILKSILISEVPFLYKQLYKIYNKIRTPNWDVEI